MRMDLSLGVMILASTIISKSVASCGCCAKVKASWSRVSTAAFRYGSCDQHTAKMTLKYVLGMIRVKSGAPYSVGMNLMC